MISVSAPNRSTSSLTSRLPPVNWGAATRSKGIPSTPETFSRGPATSISTGATTISADVPSRSHASCCSLRGFQYWSAVTATTR